MHQSKTVNSSPSEQQKLSELIDRLATELYENILRRVPSESELAMFQKSTEQIGLSNHLLNWFFNPEVIVRAQGSAQYPLVPPGSTQIGQIEALPRLVFLHIPKTAGTTLTSHLESRMGCVAFRVSSPLTPKAREFSSAWPLLSGHIAVRDLPATHSVLTVFRESRSRLLSLYSHVLTTSDPHVADHMKRLGLSDFLEACWGDATLPPFFWPISRYFAQEKTSLTVDDRLIARVSFALWSHELGRSSSIIERWLAMPIGSVSSRLNETNTSRLPIPNLILRRSDIRALEYFSQLENDVLREFTELHKLRLLSDTEEESQYRRALSRYSVHT